MNGIILCEICELNPATGILTVIREGEIEPSPMYACGECVDKIEPHEWLHERLKR